MEPVFRRILVEYLSGAFYYSETISQSKTKGGLTGAEFSPRATNNVAEYEAFINAVKHVRLFGWDQDKVVVYTDSELLKGQLKDGWKVGPELLPLHKKAMAQMNAVPHLEVRKIKRAQNHVAHRAAKAAYYEARLAKLEKKRE